MAGIIKRRWLIVGLAVVLSLAAIAALPMMVSGSGLINRATFAKLQLGITYDEAHEILGGKISDVRPCNDKDGRPFFKYGYSDDDEKMFPPASTIYFTVDNDNRLTSKEYVGPPLSKIWDRLVNRVKAAIGK